ncbi:MAG: argininosuccinate synthase [Pseudomonadota bacterium]
MSQSVNAQKKSVKKVVLAYSGGLDTSAIIPWLIENYQCEVYAFVADVGQGQEDLEGIEEKALASGAVACKVADLRESFIKDYCFPLLKTGAIYENGYLLGTSIARPIIAKAQAQYALEIGADALSHGCTGKGNDQVRFETVYANFAPHLKVIAPWREWTMVSREDLLAYLDSKNIPCSASIKKIYSRDGNAWHLSHEGGELEDPNCAPSDAVWQWTQSPKNAPDQEQVIRIGFEKGVPVTIDGETYSPFELVSQLNHTAGLHGIGRIDIVENRLVGMKSRGCYETPGGTILYAAISALQELVLDRELTQFHQMVGQQFSTLLYDGKWFSPLAQTLLKTAEVITNKVSGEVTLELYKGHIMTLARTSSHSLYSEEFATFGEDQVYEQADAEGFIKLFALPSRIQSSKAV